MPETLNVHKLFETQLEMITLTRENATLQADNAKLLKSIERLERVNHDQYIEKAYLQDDHTYLNHRTVELSEEVGYLQVGYDELAEEYNAVEYELETKQKILMDYVGRFVEADNLLNYVHADLLNCKHFLYPSHMTDNIANPILASLKARGEAEATNV